MKKITGKQAVEYAEKLKEFCKAKKSCSRCPFATKYCCLIENPDCWTVENAKERYDKEEAERDEMLDRYYNNGSSFGGMG